MLTLLLHGSLCFDLQSTITFLSTWSLITSLISDAGVIVGGAVPPLAMAVIWRRCSSLAAPIGERPHLLTTDNLSTGCHRMPQSSFQRTYAPKQLSADVCPGSGRPHAALHRLPVCQWPGISVKQSLDQQLPVWVAIRCCCGTTADPQQSGAGTPASGLHAAVLPSSATIVTATY